MTQPAPGAKFGPYRIVRRLGAGGMGVVWECVHEALQKPVALKTLHDGGVSAEIAERFVREGRAAARLRHPHVVDVTDVGVHEGTPYLVMALLEGESLASVIHRHGALDVATAIEIALPILDALGAAHALGIVHRDVKPDNVFLTRSPKGDVHPVVLDFGISKIENANVRLTGPAALMGTPAYMSPEQARGAGEVTPASDQFSLGLVFYEAFSGRRAISGSSPLEMIHRLSSGDYPPLRSIAPALAPELCAIVERMCAHDPAQRFASLREVGRALLPFAAPRTRAVWENVFGTPSLPVPRTHASNADAFAQTMVPSSSAITAPPRPSSRLPIAIAGLALAAIGVGAIAIAAFALWPRGESAAPHAANPILGSYRGTYTARATLSSPPGSPPQHYVDQGGVIVTQGPSSLLITTRSDTTGDSCTIAADWDGSAAVVRQGQTCSGRLANGASSTGTVIGRAYLEGNAFVFEVHGSMRGTNVIIPYAGVYTGRWQCTRI